MDEPRRVRVLISGAGAWPTGFSIRQAATVALGAGCLVSRRGVSVYECVGAAGEGRELAREIPRRIGTNGPPIHPSLPSECDASEACQASCGRRCVHAEVRAFLALPSFGDAGRLRMVHVKIDESGMLVPSGGPRCAPCASFLLDRGVGGIWLYEQEGLWVFYRMLDFWKKTMETCRLHVTRR